MERVGRYEIVRELGRGSMSIVYEGFDGRIDRHLAIKVLRNRYARDVNARQRFLREARAAGGLAHPNIVTVFDVGQADSAPYIVMEYLEGGTLDDWLDPDRLSELETVKLLDLAMQLARGLAYAHANGVVHRDIKPANIHYDPDVNVAKMMDFGIAATERTAEGGEDDGRIAGTLTHMAPELLAGHSPDARSDLYSLGIVLYQLLSGTLPFDTDDAETLVRQIARHEARPLHSLRSDTPKELIDLTYRLMALEPESRPSSATQVADELAEIREGLQRGLVQSVRRKSAVWRWPLLTGLGVAAVLVLGMNYLYRTQNEAMAETTFGFGDALASLIAQETAEALILEDNTALSVLVSDFAANPEIQYVHISDRAGVVQASTNPYLRGESAPRVSGTAIERDSGAVELTRSDNGVLEFRVPIRFQARRVGQVRLGLDGSGLDQTAAATMWMLVILFFAAVLALGAGLAWMTRRQQVGLRRLAWGLKRLQRGQYEFRLESDRRDEFASAFRQFNQLAVRLDELSRSAQMEPRRASRSGSVPADAKPDQTLDLGDDETAESAEETAANVTRLR
jgi:serine/threonine-protein kinase